MNIKVNIEGYDGDNETEKGGAECLLYRNKNGVLVWRAVSPVLKSGPVLSVSKPFFQDRDEYYWYFPYEEDDLNDPCWRLQDNNTEVGHL